MQTPGVCLGPFGLGDDLDKRKQNWTYRKCSMFWVCLGLITVITATKSKRSAYGQTQGFLLVLLEGKETENCGQYWGWWSGACVPAAPPKRWHNFSKNWKSSENTSHQEPGHLGLNSSTPAEPEILGLLQLLLRRLTKPSRITALLQALPQTPLAA